MHVPRTTDDEADMVHPRERARRQRWTLLIIFFLLALAGVVTWRFWLTARTEAMIEAIRASGEPVSLKEFNQSLPAMPPEHENGGPIYQRVFGMLHVVDEFYVSLNPVPNGFSDPREDEPYPDAVMDEAVRYLEQHGPALALLDEADAMPHSRMTREVTPDFILPNLGRYRHTSRLRLLQARVAAELGDGEAATQGLLGSWRLGERLAEEPPFLITHLVRITLRSATVQALERIVNLTGLSDDQLARLEAAISVEISDDALYRLVLVDRMSVIEVFPKIVRNDPTWAGAVFPTGKAGRWAGVGYLISGLYDMDFMFYLEHLRRGSEAAREPLPLRLEKLQEIDKFFEDSLNGYGKWSKVIAGALGSSFGHVCRAEARIIAHARVAAAALAVRRYRLAEGRLPDSLDALVPEYLAAVPVDPFTGLAVVYKKEEPGFVVYSLGEDKTDDGGAKFNATGQAFAPGTDIPFRVKK